MDRPRHIVLMYPLDHELVPLHRRATEADRALLPASVTRKGLSQLPTLRRDDPVVQYLALVVGDVVYIERLDGTVYFRVVVPNH